MIQSIRLDARVSGTTLLTGLIGNPVAHTVSPVLQNSFFTAMGIDGIYLPFKVNAGSLGDAVKGLKAAGFIGFNVTIPYKHEVLDLVDEISEEVELIGAANTVRIENGKLFAYNSDADGFARAFEEQSGTGFEGKKVCILGAGGTARTLAMKIGLKGADRVFLINRTAERAQELSDFINRAMEKKGRGGNVIHAAGSKTDEAGDWLSNCDIIVNTTSVGMHPNTGECPVETSFAFQSRQIVYDTIYNPAETKLLWHARSCGCKTVNGAGMLFHQGLRAFEIWNRLVVPAEISNGIWTEFQKYLAG